MKIVWVICWLILGLEACFLLWQVATPHPGMDAAGKGFTVAYQIVLAIFIVVPAVFLLLSDWQAANVLFKVGVLVTFAPLLIFASYQIQQSLSIEFQQNQISLFGQFKDDRLTDAADAIDQENWQKLETLLRNKNIDHDQRDLRDQTLLGYAVMRAIESPDKLPGIEIIINSGAPLNGKGMAESEQNPYGLDMFSAVYRTRSAHSLALMDLLLEKGIEVQPGSEGVPILFSEYTDLPRLKLLAKYNVDLSQLDNHSKINRGWTLLMRAAARSEWEVAEFLIDQGVPVDHIAEDGKSFSSILKEHKDFLKRTNELPSPESASLLMRY